MHVMQALRDRLGARRHAAAARLLVQIRHAGAVRTDQHVADTVAIFRRLDQHRPRAIAEQHTGRTIGVVEDRRHLVGADHDDFLGAAVLDELRRDRERIEEARAGRLHVE